MQTIRRLTQKRVRVSQYSVRVSQRKVSVSQRPRAKHEGEDIVRSHGRP